MAEVIDGRRISFSVVFLLHVMLTKESTVTPLYLHICECLQRRENLHLCVAGALDFKVSRQTFLFKYKIATSVQKANA